MRVWQVGQAMTRSRAASRSRRAAGTLRVGGEAGPCLTGGVEEGVAPDQGDQGQMAVQARPGSSLIVAEPELLLAILMEALHGPALVSQPELIVERTVVERPGDVPLGLTVLTRKGALADEPAERASGVAVRAANPQAAGLTLTPLLLRIEDGHRHPRHSGENQPATV